MKPYLSILAASSLLFAAAPAASAAITLGLLTFESGAEGWSSFAQNSGSVSTIPLVAGADGFGVATRINSAVGGFAGGGTGSPGPFVLTTAGIASGTVTVDDIDKLAVSLDVNIPVGQAIALRLEPASSSSGFNNRIELSTSVSGTGTFQTLTFNLADIAQPTQKATFVTEVNALGNNGIRLVFGVNGAANAVGTDYVFDNVGITYVPEPSSILSLVLGGTLLGLRRRRTATK